MENDEIAEQKSQENMEEMNPYADIVSPEASNTLSNPLDDNISSNRAVQSENQQALDICQNIPIAVEDYEEKPPEEPKNNDKKIETRNSQSRQSLKLVMDPVDHLSTDSIMSNSDKKSDGIPKIVPQEKEQENFGQSLRDDSGFLLERPNIVIPPDHPFSPPVIDMQNDLKSPIDKNNDFISSATIEDEYQYVEKLNNEENPIENNVIQPKPAEIPDVESKSVKLPKPQVKKAKLVPRRYGLQGRKNSLEEKPENVPPIVKTTETDEINSQISKLKQEIIELEIEHSRRISQMSPKQFDNALLASKNNYYSNLIRAYNSYSDQLSRVNKITKSINNELEHFSSSKSFMTSSFISSELSRESGEISRSISYVKKEIDATNDASEVIITAKDAVIDADIQDMKEERNRLHEEIEELRAKIFGEKEIYNSINSIYERSIELIESKMSELVDESEDVDEIIFDEPISRNLFDNAVNILERRKKAQDEYNEAKSLPPDSPGKEDILSSSLIEYRSTIALLPNVSVEQLYNDLKENDSRLSYLNDSLRNAYSASISVHSDLLDANASEIVKKCNVEVMKSKSGYNFNQKNAEAFKVIENEETTRQFNLSELKSIGRWAQKKMQYNDEHRDVIETIWTLCTSLD